MARFSRSSVEFSGAMPRESDLLAVGLQQADEDIHQRQEDGGATPIEEKDLGLGGFKRE